MNLDGVLVAPSNGAAGSPLGRNHRFRPFFDPFLLSEATKPWLLKLTKKSQQSLELPLAVGGSTRYFGVVVEPGGETWGTGEGPGNPVLPDVADVPGPCFLGRFAHTLDDKRRVAIPKTFREEI